MIALIRETVPRAWNFAPAPHKAAGLHCSPTEGNPPAQSAVGGSSFPINAVRKTSRRFATLLILEMFYGVSHIDRTAVEPCLFQSQIEDTAGRPNEWTTLPVFLIARLFADQQQRRVNRAFTKNDLRCIPI
jgi:hypothetical protein